MLTIDLSLKNEWLYRGCVIEEVAGRLNLATPPAQAVNIIGKNIMDFLSSLDPSARDSVLLTGPMAVWAYLIVFHAVLHAFGEVWYSDGRTEILLARHGVARGKHADI